MILKRFRLWVLSSLMLTVIFTVTACDPMAPVAPVVVMVTESPTRIPTRALTATPTLTRTPIPSATPNFTATPTPFPCDQDGTLIELSLESELARETLNYDVYAPPCYFESTLRFPVVYLLHGLQQRQTQWQDLGIIQALDQGIRLGVLPPMLVVMPSYGNIGTRNIFPPDTSFESVMLNELIPQVEIDFCTISNRGHRAIGGISRGGFWAFSMAMRYPDVFSIVGGHSAFFPDDPDEVPAAFNPLELARNSTTLPAADLRIYLDNGARDFTGLGQQTFSDRLTTRSIPHTYIINPIGEHDNDYWSTHIGEYLEFYGRDWEQNYSALPTCLEPSPS
ncbi:MAG: alpha/beta hydrolase-fold protein [Anaerolineae bacterium]|nr:alpha/beta hydrolase-fold protein [Anaerolineae bacterium]